jgi:hypothetical protein
MSASAQTGATSTAKGSDSEKKKGGAFGGALAKMLEDPDMKKMMRQQQLVMMDTMYGPLFKELGLSPEETEKFKELLIDGQMKGVEGAGALFSGDRDPAERAEAIKAMGEQQKQLDEQLKTFLGDERYAQYKDYQESMGERTSLDQFQNQLAGGQNPLTEEQSGQLLALMKEERKNSPSIFGKDPNAMPDPDQLEAMLSEEKMNKHFEQQEELNRRILERAKAVLTPEQLVALNNHQNSQLQMQRFGMTMALKFMSGENSEDESKADPK